MSGPALVKVDADKAEALRRWAAENGYGPGAKASRPAPKPAVEASEPEPPARIIELPDTWRVDCGECVSLLKGLPDSCVDAIVTDPPYEIGFMGKSWDSTGVAYDPKTWAECLRVLKPGGHLLAFAATRTYHRIAVAVEDAGFEIRDMVEWIYGTGFPKSLDVSKAIDKSLGAKGEYGAPKSAAHAGWIDRGRMRGEEGHEGYQRPWMDDTEAVDRNARQYLPGTSDAQKWAGWGTALKPAHEPIVLARKPLAGTVAGNVLEHGVGALNVDGCRVAGTVQAGAGSLHTFHGGEDGYEKGTGRAYQSEGRWPANLILSEDAAADLDESSPETASKKGKPRGSEQPGEGWGMTATGAEYDDRGGPSRFFYVAKPSRNEREAGLEEFAKRRAVVTVHGGLGDAKNPNHARANIHPTVKPVALMRYLCRLVTPPDGIVVDPFAGSGTTGIGATLEGFRFLGFELDAGHAEIARARIQHWAEGAE